VLLLCLKLPAACWTGRQEADSQAVSLRSQASAREDRLQAQFASRLAQLQSELDGRCAAAADREGALAAAKDEISRLAVQVGTSCRDTGAVWVGQEGVNCSIALTSESFKCYAGQCCEQITSYRYALKYETDGAWARAGRGGAKAGELG